MEQGINKYQYQLSTASQTIFNALTSPLIRTLSDLDLLQAVKKAVVNAYFEIGFAPPTQKDFDLMCASILRNIRLDDMAIRVNEIEIAFQYGILKTYGEFMGLSIVSFTQFIKGYIMSNTRMEALKEFNKPAQEERKEPTPEEIKDAYITRLKTIFSNYKQKSNLSASECTFYFKQLWKERIIVFTPEITQQLKNQALKEVLGSIDFTKAKDIHESKKMRAHYDSIQQNSDSDEKVLNYAKYLGLLKWFDMLIETEQEVEDML